MKAKTRRSLLISSVAMLLVAMLSLGTATYAWFTNTTTATAENAQVTVAAPSGLVIAAVISGTRAPAASAYASRLNLADESTGLMKNVVLEPTSFNAIETLTADPKFFKVEMNSDKVVSEIKKTTENYFAIDIYGKLSGTGTDTKMVSLKNITGIDSSVPGKVVRCAFYGVNDAGKAYLRKAYTNFDTSNPTVYPVTTEGSGLSIQAGADYTIPSGDSHVGTGLTTATFSTSQEIKTVDHSGTLLGTLYFWVEGQDPDCHNQTDPADEAALLSTVSGISFEFSIPEN